MYNVHPSNVIKIRKKWFIPFNSKTKISRWRRVLFTNVGKSGANIAFFFFNFSIMVLLIKICSYLISQRLCHESTRNVGTESNIWLDKLSESRVVLHSFL
uniref:Uncharacterized protein n=1 Tax=Cacopsylla melanoneura TaxID=428564 RepID=A0A8D8XB92_9HEMI